MSDSTPSLPQRFQAIVAEYLASIDPTGDKPELSWVTADGRRSTVSVVIAKPNVKPLARVQLKMLAVLGKSPVPLTRKQLAPLTNSPIIEGRWGRMVKDLLTRGMIFERNGKLADTENKLETA